WQGRRDPLLTLLMRRNIRTGRPAFQISSEGCELLISALRSRWYYPTIDGVTSRELPLKNHPWSDLGDGLCYLVGGAAPPAPPWDTAHAVKVETRFDPREMFSPHA